MVWTVLVSYFLCLTLIVLYNIVYLSFALVAFFAKKPKKLPLLPADDKEIPFVSVQLPIYNEAFVVERLIMSVLAMDYPKSKWEVQILDDSTDETTKIIEDCLEKLPEGLENVPVHHFRRALRVGYKAGALGESLPHTKGELVAIFDADFIPPKDFLRRSVSYFRHEPKLAFVQARWGHLNGDENVLTHGLSSQLDMQFHIEYVASLAQRFPIYFGGTAGIWSKRCINEVGGWKNDTLAEDTDISIRAHLNGWHGSYLHDTVCFAEVPASVDAMCSQQWRWNKGRAQVARKHFWNMLFSSLPWRQKCNCLPRLTVGLLYPFIFLASVLSFPLLYVKQYHAEFSDIFRYSGLAAIVFLSWSGSISAVLRKAKQKHHIKALAFMLLVSAGLGWRNTLAVLSGWMGLKSAFIRTPKKGAQAPALASNTKTNTTHKMRLRYLFEAVWAAYFAGAVAYGVCYGEYGMLPFHLLLTFGYGIICGRGIRGV